MEEENVNNMPEDNPFEKREVEIAKAPDYAKRFLDSQMKRGFVIPTIHTAISKPNTQSALKELAKLQEEQLLIILNSGRREIIFGNIPSKSNCYRIITFKSKDPKKHSHASLAKTPELKQYEKNFAIQCKVYKGLNFDIDFSIEIQVYYPSRRADLDNSLKVLLDCLQEAKAIKNDNRCMKIIAERFVDVNNPRVEFVIKPSNQ